MQCQGGLSQEVWGRSSVWLEHSTVTREVAGSSPVAPVVEGPVGTGELVRGKSQGSTVGPVLLGVVCMTRVTGGSAGPSQPNALVVKLVDTPL